MAIKKHEEIRLNVKPIFLTLYHEYVFEGPCRFGEGIQLEKEFDLHMAAEKFKGWYAQLQAAMPENVVNLLEPDDRQARRGKRRSRPVLHRVCEPPL